MNKGYLATSLVLSSALFTMSVQAKDSVFVGHLVDFSGPTAYVSKPYGSGVRDALFWINKHGGIDGTELEYETVDMAYKVPVAISNYKRWVARKDMVAMQGWGTADTEALISFVTKDKVPVFSASYSGHLTDPKGKNPKTAKPAPYNFFYGSSYSDACRALVKWAKNDWEEKGNTATPKFTHIGDNHPFPNAPKAACAEYAQELGFEVQTPVVVSLKPGDFKAQCLSLKESGTNYGYIANLGGSVISLVKSCNTVGTEFQYMANIWGGDKPLLQAAGAGLKDYVFPGMTAFWGDDTEGMKLVRDISALSASEPDQFRTHHYIRGICSAFYMKEAMEWAKANGGITGENIKQGMYARENWVPNGLEGVCIPANWQPDDHRGTTTVNVFMGNNNDGKVDVNKVAEVTLSRREDWLGY